MPLQTKYIPADRCNPSTGRGAPAEPLPQRIFSVRKTAGIPHIMKPIYNFKVVS